MISIRIKADEKTKVLTVEVEGLEPLLSLFAPKVGDIVISPAPAPKPEAKPAKTKPKPTPDDEAADALEEEVEETKPAKKPAPKKPEPAKKPAPAKKGKTVEEEEAEDTELDEEAADEVEEEAADEEAEEEAEGDGPTLEDVRQAILKVTKVIKIGPALDIVEKVSGVRKANAVPEDKIADVIAALEAVTKKPKK